jgi:hypothetical protein
LFLLGCGTNRAQQHAARSSNGPFPEDKVERTNFYVPGCRLQCYSTTTVTSFLNFINFERVEKDQKPFVCINSIIFSFSRVEFKIQHEMSVVSCHSGEAVSRKREALLFRISSAKKFLLLDLSDCEFGPLSSMAEYLTPND